MKTKRHKMYLITMLCFILIILSNMNTIIGINLDWDFAESAILNEDDNIAYGAFVGNSKPHTQYLTNNLSTDITYVKEGIGTYSQSLANSSQDYRSVIGSSYFSSFNHYDSLKREWVNLPTFIKATNKTKLGPTLNLTSGLKKMGYLCLNTKLTFEMDAKMVYLFYLELEAFEFYDLNIKSAKQVNYQIYFNETLSYTSAVDGVSQYIQPLFARDTGSYLLYLYSSSYNYVSLKPRKLAMEELLPNQMITKDFKNEPSQIWNETRQDWQPNIKKETIHAYSLVIPKGVYTFSLRVFDDSVSPFVSIRTNSMVYTSSSEPTFADLLLFSGFIDDFSFFFERETKITLYVMSDLGDEFEYLLSVNEVNIPSVNETNSLHYVGKGLTFALNLSETKLIYLNASETINNLIVLKYQENGTYFSFSYDLETTSSNADKIILKPGYYLFMEPFAVEYDVFIDFGTVDILETDFSEIDYMNFTLSQITDDSSQYRLFAFDIEDAYRFLNFNISIISPYNYTAELTYELINSHMSVSTFSNTEYFGNQDLNGSVYAYPQNNTQLLSFFTSSSNTTRYVLFHVNAIYNNTGKNWFIDGPGKLVSNRTAIDFKLILDPGSPDDLEDVEVQNIKLNLLDNGTGIKYVEFDDTPSDYKLFLIKINNVPINTWYHLSISIYNGRLVPGYISYDFNLPDYNRPQVLSRMAIWNQYYYKDYYDSTFSTFFSSEVLPNYYNYQIEFGTVSENLFIFFALDNTAVNGIALFKLTPHKPTIISPLKYGNFTNNCPVEERFSTRSIIVLSVFGGSIVLGTLIYVIVRLTRKGIRSKTPI